MYLLKQLSKKTKSKFQLVFSPFLILKWMEKPSLAENSSGLFLGWSLQNSSVCWMLLHPKGRQNQLEPVQQSRQQWLRAYCPNIYNVLTRLACCTVGQILETHSKFMRFCRISSSELRKFIANLNIKCFEMKISLGTFKIYQVI